MADSKHNLSLIIKAVDQATGPLGRMTSGLIKKLSPIAKAAGSVGSSLKNVGSEALALGAKVVGGLAAGGIALYTLVHGAAEAGHELEEASQRVGMTATQYASLGYAAKQSGIDQESFTSGMDTFNKSLGQANIGYGRFYKALVRASPTFAKQIKGAKSTAEGVELMQRAFELVKNPAERAAIATAAFGDPKFGQFLGQQGFEIQKLVAKYQELHGNVDEFAKKSGDVDRALKSTEEAFGGARDVIALALYPAVTKLALALTKFLVSNRAQLEQWAASVGKAIGAWLDGGGLDRLTNGVAEFGKQISAVVDFIGGWKNAAIGVALVMAGPLLSAVGSLTLALVSFGVAVAPAFVAILPFTLAIAGLSAAVYELYKHWADLKAIFSDFSLGNVARLGGFGVGMLTGGLTDKSFFKSDEDAYTRSALRGVKGGSGQPPGVTNTNNAKVEVEFKNAPKGTRASVVRSDANGSVDLSLGYNGVNP